MSSPSLAALEVRGRSACRFAPSPRRGGRQCLAECIARDTVDNSGRSGIFCFLCEHDLWGAATLRLAASAHCVGLQGRGATRSQLAVAVLTLVPSAFSLVSLSKGVQ